jgi:uncharacterized protein
MKLDGRRLSGNIEDRRGMSKRKMAVGGGLGTIIIILIIVLMGGDPSQLLNMQDSTPVETGPVSTSAEETSMEKLVSVVLAGTEDVWGKIFRESNLTYRQPKLVLFRDEVQSACGYATAASGPFYCPGDEKVYIDLSFCDDLRTKFGAYGDFAVAYAIAHEVGHHVQNLLGILEKTNNQRSRLSETSANKLTVRLELQADFLAGMWAHYDDQMFHSLEAGDIEEAMNAAAAVGDDILQRKYSGRVYPDSFTHGTSAQRKTWFEKGWKTGDFEQGDTFNSEI